MFKKKSRKIGGFGNDFNSPNSGRLYLPLSGGHSLAPSFLAVNTKDEYDQTGVYGVYMGKDHLLRRNPKT